MGQINHRFYVADQAGLNEGWSETYLGETDLIRVLPEALTAEVEAVLANDTSLVSAETADGSAMLGPIDLLIFDTHHWREPFPYLRGRENQTESCVILKRRVS
jgi:hypothetical protein